MNFGEERWGEHTQKKLNTTFLLLSFRLCGEEWEGNSVVPIMQAVWEDYEDLPYSVDVENVYRNFSHVTINK